MGAAYAYCMPSRPSTRETIARNLRMLMESSNPPLNQVELAKRAGVAQKSVSNMLDPSRPGVSAGTLDKLERVAAAFGLTAWHLLIPTLPEDLKECHRISDLVADYIVTPKTSRDLIYHTAERERKLVNHDD